MGPPNFGIMIARRLCAAVALAAFLSAVSSVSLSSAEERGLEEEAQVFIQLIDSIESEFDCLIKIVSIDEIPTSSRSHGRFFATFDAAGIQCAQASDKLLNQGRKEKIVFFRRNDPIPKKNRQSEPILDLIHEIDPPLDN